MALNSDIRPDAQSSLELEEPTPVPAPDNSPSSRESQDAEDTVQIMQELRQTKAEQAVAERRNRKLTLDKATFGITGVLALAFVAWGFLGRDSLSTTSTLALDWVMEYTGWLFMVLASLFVVYVLWLALGKFGNIPLGKDGEKPEFRTVSWIAMMFAAGMGIGLMFYGVAEPLYHYISPPPGTVDGQTPGRHPDRHGHLHLPLDPAPLGDVRRRRRRHGLRHLPPGPQAADLRRLHVPLRQQDGRGAGGKVHQHPGHLRHALRHRGVPGPRRAADRQRPDAPTAGWARSGTPVLVAIVAVLTVCFVASAVSGIRRGIQWLSNINMVLAVLLALIVFVAGPTLFILNLIPAAVGDYARDLAEMASRTEAVGDEALRTWMSGWTIFYWAWWVSWTPFVGMFIARISRGRTIRQFVTGVLLVPSLVSVIWFGIFGGTAFNIQSAADQTEDPADGLVTMVDGAPSISFDGALFDLIQQPAALRPAIAAAVAVLAMVLVGIFFVTGRRLGVAGHVHAELQRLRPSRPAGLVIFWGLLTGAVAAVMLLAGGDEPSEALSGLQRITIVAALPFVLVMLLLCFALTRDLRRDPLSLRRRLASNVVERAIRNGVDQHGGVQFDLVTRHECDGRCSAEKRCPGDASTPAEASTPNDAIN